MKESLALGKQGLHGQSGKVGGNILESIISTEGPVVPSIVRSSAIIPKA